MTQNSIPVYEAKVTLHGVPSLVPMTVIWSDDYGGTWVVGYVMPSGHRKRYNVKDNYMHKTEAEAVAKLETIAQTRKWRPWPADRPVECIEAARS